MLLFEFLTGDIEPGLPTFKLPPFQIERQVDDDEIQVLNFSDICAEIGAMGIALFPLVSILEQVAIAKTYCKFVYVHHDAVFFICYSLFLNRLYGYVEMDHIEIISQMQSNISHYSSRFLFH
jgi:hypothetical protein